MNVNAFDTSDQFMHLQTIQLTSTKAIVCKEPYCPIQCSNADHVLQ